MKLSRAMLLPPGVMAFAEASPVDLGAPAIQPFTPASGNPRRAGGTMEQHGRHAEVEAAVHLEAACTTTLTPVRRYPCVTEGYETVYPSTRTAFAQVDCGGCSELFIPREVYFCPMRRVLGIRTADGPSTSWSTVCDGRATPRILGRSGLSRMTPAAAAAATPTGADAGRSKEEEVSEGPRELRDRQACQTTRTVQPQRTAGPVATHYQRVVTETFGLDCKGCQLEISTAVGGYGPVVRFTTTTTAPVGTSTVFVCQ